MTNPAGVTDEMVDQAGAALREHDMKGRFTVPWASLPKSQKKKWLEKGAAALTAALAGRVVVPAKKKTALTETQMATLREMAAYKHEYWFRQATSASLVKLGLAEQLPGHRKKRPHRITEAGRAMIPAAVDGGAK